MIVILNFIFSSGICTQNTGIKKISISKTLIKESKNYFIQNYLNHTILTIHSIDGEEYKKLYNEIEDLYKLEVN